jgi:Mn2+/Fe2+ NRAMP family transporter
MPRTSSNKSDDLSPAVAPLPVDPGPVPKKQGWLRLLKILGPGLITGAADDDPSGIATYSQTGAQFGFGQLWTALYQIPLLLAVQEACARIGSVTLSITHNFCSDSCPERDVGQPR